MVDYFKNITKYIKNKSFLPEEQVDILLQKRIAELEDSAEKVAEISPIQMTCHKGYILNETEIITDPSYSGFFIDDAIYKSALLKIQEVCMQEAFEETDPEQIVIYGIYLAVCDYFGNYDLDEEIFDVSKKFFEKLEKAVSVKELKGKGIGTAVMKAPLVNNCLEFFGFSSDLVYAYIPNSEEQPLLHAYNIAKGQDIYYIIESSYPQYFRENDEEGDILMYWPGIYEISKEQYTLFDAVEVDNVDYVVIDDAFIPYAHEKRMYYMPGKSNYRLPNEEEINDAVLEAFVG